MLITDASIETGRAPIAIDGNDFDLSNNNGSGEDDDFYHGVIDRLDEGYLSIDFTEQGFGGFNNEQIAYQIEYSVYTDSTRTAQLSGSPFLYLSPLRYRNDDDTTNNQRKAFIPIFSLCEQINTATDTSRDDLYLTIKLFPYGQQNKASGTYTVTGSFSC